MTYDPDRKVFIGETEKRGEVIRFGIREEDRSRHIYVIGQTGTGKSTFLEMLAMQDMENGEGLIFMDPHGQSVDSLLEYVTPNSLDRVIYFAPHLQDRPIGLNIMEDVGYDHRHHVVSSLMASFEKIWGETSWSDRMAYILQNTLLALLEYPGTTLLDVGRMYSSKDFRTKVVENVKDPQVRRYWVDEYANYSERYVQDATPAIQNKLGQFTSNPLMRNIIGQKKSAFNFRQVMDEGKVLLVNLSKGRIGDNNARMLGILFTTKIYLSALSRSDLSPQQLDATPACNFYVDEFQSFANSTFSSILSEARKYKLNLILAHQYIGQIYSGDSGDGNAIRDAVFGNVGTFISFRVGPVDAEVIAKQFAPAVTEEDLVALPRFHMFLTLNIGGAGSTPFSARTYMKPAPPPVSIADQVIKQSMQQYGVDREEIEDQVRKNIEQDWKEKKEKPGGRGAFKKPGQKGKAPQRGVTKAVRDALGGRERRDDRADKQKPDQKQQRSDDRKEDASELRNSIQEAKMSGMPKPLQVPKKEEEKEAPPIRYEDGWVSLGDLQEEDRSKESV
ncbi:MAG: type IV secretion system DNA-binding domain-containing protein [Candidatus Kaiserbacteria bacterium]|nr:type IV secretion system DNA-binding domain-containing protein [Candidatus Kaiserbacteria bacterium]